MSLVRVENVHKCFRHRADSRLLRDYLTELFTGRARVTDQFYALRDVSFVVEPGESVALVGSNGAGKTTLLSLLCGLARPDSGRIHLTGRVAPLMSLGAGFHPDLTGRENLYLNASLLGMSEAEVKSLLPEIVDFAELGPFLDDPLRVYSAGMTLRLGFAVAVHCSAEIMVIDEVLAVGDAAFQNKCLARLRDLQDEGRSVLFVSHSNEMVRQFCDRAIWLHSGQIRMDASAESVIDRYTAFLHGQQPDRLAVGAE